MENILIEIFSEALSMNSWKIKPDVPVANYGVDSVVAVDVVYQLEEKFNIRLDEDEIFMNDPTIADLSNMVLQKIEESKEAELQI